MLTGNVPSPIFLFKDEGKELSGPTGDETAEMKIAEMAGDEVEFVTRARLLDRPPMQELPDDPGHWVSCHDVNDLD